MEGINSDPFSQKSSHLWKCEGFSGGIYKFRMKAEFESAVGGKRARREKNRLIAPAIEFSAKQVMKKLPSATSKLELLMSSVLKELGYFAWVDEEGTCMRLPGHREFEKRWGKLQEQYPKLAQLRILPGRGIAGDGPFIEGHLTHDVVLSADWEFVHDQLIHLVGQVKLFVGLAEAGEDYSEYKKGVADETRRLYQKVQSVELKVSGVDSRFGLDKSELAMVNRSLGAVVDVYTSRKKKVDPSRFSYDVRHILQDESGDFYRKSKEDFGAENLKRLPLLWNKIDLANAALDGYPKLAGADADDLFEDNEELQVFCSSNAIWVRSEVEWAKAVPYEVVEGNRLVVYTGEHSLEVEGVGAEALRQLGRLVLEGERKLDALIQTIPKELQPTAEGTFQPPGDPDSLQPGDFLTWRWKHVYGNGFGFSVVKQVGMRQSFVNQTVIPRLKDNEVGFEISSFNEEHAQFFRVTSHDRLMEQLKKRNIS